MNLGRRVMSLEKTAARPVGTCTCSPPRVVWDAGGPGRNVHGGDRPERCGACRKPREVIRVVYYDTPLPEHATVGGST